MKTNLFSSAFIALLFISFSACTPSAKTKIVDLVGQEEYDRLINLSLDDFDQSSEGFRKHYANYELLSLIIPEYIQVNKIADNQARNLHWHLGQIHAFNDNYEAAITEMKQSYAGGPIYWKCYVDGSIAFLEKDKPALEKALSTLRQQDNQMNIEFLEKFLKYFDQSYAEAYNASY